MEVVELCNRRTALFCTIPITFIILISNSGASLLQDAHLVDSPSEAKAPADLESLELVPDPDLANPHDVVVVGESSEFSHDYDTDGTRVWIEESYVT